MATGSFSTIFIQRNIPVEAGYVRVPPNFSGGRTKVSIAAALIASNGTLVRLLASGGASTAGGRYGAQELIQLPPVAVNNSVDVAYNAVIAENPANNSTACTATEIVYNSTTNVTYNGGETWITFIPVTNEIDILLGVPCNIVPYVGPCNDLTQLLVTEVFGDPENGLYVDASAYPSGTRLYVKITGLVGVHATTVIDD